VQFWDLATGLPAQAPLVRFPTWSVLSPDGTKLAKVIHDGTSSPRCCRIYDAASGRPLTPLLEHSNQIGIQVFSPDSKILAVGPSAWGVFLYEAATGRPLARAMWQNDIVLALAFSPNGKVLAAGTTTDWNRSPQSRLW